MKHFTLFLRKGFTSTLALAVAMIVFGGGSALADTVIVDGSTIADGWTNGGATNFTASTGKITSVSQAFLTTTSGQLSPANTYTWYSIVSNNKIEIAEGQTIEIGVKALNDYGGELIVTSSSDATKFTNVVDITTEIRSNDAMNNFQTIIIENIPEGESYLQIIGKAIYINSAIIKGDGAAVTTPKLSVSPSNIAFGALRASDTQTVTVTNTGVGSMDVSIANDNTTDFTVSATSLTGIGEGESKTFDVTFNYNAESLGDKSANITVTPSYDETDAKTIEVSATAANAAVWEDFTDGIPSTWYNENDSWLNYVTNLSGWASPGYNSTHVLRTPRLYAEAGSTLGFDVKIVGKYTSNKVTASYSTDRVTWSTPVDYTDDGTYAIEAPATGYYWVQFTASQAGIDNITGWTVADPIHETRLGDTTIPATGTAYGTYTAYVVVKELGGSNETVTAELYFGEEKVAEQTGIAVNGNRDVTVSLSYLPTETFDGKVYIKVTGENIGTLESDKVDVVISETPYVFDEDSDENPVISSNSVVKVKYTARQGWNTIVMPFSLSSSPAYMNTIFGEGWKAYAIDASDEGTISFKSTTYMATTTPFIVYAPNAESHPNGVYLQNVSAGSYNWGHTNINQTTDDITFKGTFAPIAAPGMEGKYGVTSEGKIAKGGSKASIKAYHAYFEVPAGLGIKGFVIDGEDATDIGLVQMVEGSDKPVYNMSGQKVQKAQRGIYIINGKKVVIR